MSSAQISQTKSLAAWRSEIGEYFAMTKPTVSLLVVITAIPGALLAGQGNIPDISAMLAILFTPVWLKLGSLCNLRQNNRRASGGLVNIVVVIVEAITVNVCGAVTFLLTNQFVGKLTCGVRSVHNND